MGVTIVTDSTADLPVEEAKRWGVRVVPLYVNFQKADKGLETLRDGVDIGPDEFYKRLVGSNPLPTTSQPAVQDFLSVYQEEAKKGNQVVSVHISSKLSGTVNSATQAKEQMGSAGKVVIVDSLLASMGLGIAALAGARLAKGGAGQQEVAEEARRAAAETKVFFMVDTLEYLQKGGRIGRAQAFLGSLLNVKPILTLGEGEIHPMERVRSRGKALERLAGLAEGIGSAKEVWVCHSTTPQDAEALALRLGKLVQGGGDRGRVMVTRLGPVVGAHVGPGLVGGGVRRGG
ncbi:MAG: DegV family protein, partial [SAR202 cluster bacterium]|nr:DegV family protein [SAR202 cluster bacterium]